MSYLDVNITLDKNDLSMALLAFGKKGMSTVVSRAINETLRGVRTDATPMLKDATGARTKAAINKNIKLHNANRIFLGGSMDVMPRGIPLKQTRDAKFKRGRGGGVQWKGKQIARSFKLKTTKFLEGKEDFWVRTGAEQFPIKRLYGYTLPQEYRHLKMQADLETKSAARMRKAWRRNFEREALKYGF